MRPRTKVLLLAAIIIAGLAFFCLRKSEPSYQGKSLSEWLRQEPVPSCCGEEMKLSEETKEALRIMGPNIVPYLVKKVGRKESGFRKSLVDFCSKHNLPSFIKDNSEEIYAEKERGVSAFEVIGPEARSAIPSLSALLKDDETAYHAARALVTIGDEAMPAMIQALSSKNVETVCSVTASLSLAATNAVRAIPALLVNLTNANRHVRILSVWTLGDIHSPSTLQHLIGAISDPSPDVHQSAIRAIGYYTTNAISALPMLTALAANPDLPTRRSAIESIKKIDGTNGFPRFFGWLASTNAEIRAAGVQALHGYALTNLTCRIALTNALQDANENIRIGASNVLGNFPRIPPGGRRGRRSP